MNSRTRDLVLASVLLLLPTLASSASLVLVKDLDPGPGSGIDNYLIGLDDKVFFWGYDGSNGALGNPFVSDGSETGTVLIRDIMGSAGFFATYQPPSQIQGVALFSVDDGFSNFQLWRSDGSDAGTFALTSESSFSGANPGQIIAFGNRAMLSAYCININGARCLWFTDGTPGGTLPTPPGNFFFNQERFTSLHGNALFTANNIVGQTTPGLYFSDGTTVGTNLVSASLNSVSAMLAFNTQIIFTPSTAAEGIEPWVTSGAAGDAVILANINTGSASSNPTLLARVDDLVFFEALQPGTGRELWKTDGTPVGTQLVKDIRSGNLNSDISSPVSIHGKLYFSANNGLNGNELWVSDGSTVGTHLVKDVNVGAAGSDPLGLTSVNDRLFFSASDGAGRRLWMSDGSSDGTLKLDNTVEAGSTIAQANGSLYLTGYEPSIGTELHRLDVLGGDGLPYRWCAKPNFQIRDNTSFTTSFKLPSIARPLNGVRVVLDITHSFASDLQITLSHTESGHSSLLLDRPGSTCSGHNADVVLDDAATTAIQTSCASAPGNAYTRDASYRPATDLSSINGDDLAGTWNLKVQDEAAGNIGTLNEWCLDFDRIAFGNFD
jgi:trimeric autotransporter adhesin